jgi:hypothetical protein
LKKHIQLRNNVAEFSDAKHKKRPQKYKGLEKYALEFFVRFLFGKDEFLANL